MDMWVIKTKRGWTLIGSSHNWTAIYDYTGRERYVAVMNFTVSHLQTHNGDGEFKRMHTVDKWFINNVRTYINSYIA
jgi:hypothetical protein